MAKQRKRDLSVEEPREVPDLKNKIALPPAARGIAAKAVVKPDRSRESLPDLSKARPSKVVLGLDLGSACGYAVGLVRTPLAVGDGPHTMYLGQFDLSSGKYESGAIRFLRLRHMLAAISPVAIFYEEPKATPPGGPVYSAASLLARAMPAAEFLAALKATVCTWAEEHGIPCAALTIGAIKRYATGKGNASKEEMIFAVNARLGVNLPVEPDTLGTHNMADAAFVLLLGLSEQGAGL